MILGDTLGIAATATGYSTTGLGGNTNISSGGYCKIGKLVVVNIRGTTTTAVSPSGTLLTGLPRPATSITGNVMAVASNLDFPFFLTAGGNITTPSSGAGGSNIASGSTVMLSITYVSDS